MNRWEREFDPGSERTLLVSLRHCELERRERKVKGKVYGGRETLRKRRDRM